MKKIFCKTHAQ